VQSSDEPRHDLHNHIYSGVSSVNSVNSAAKLQSQADSSPTPVSRSQLGSVSGGAQSCSLSLSLYLTK
jgi:hypothetical protein